jgi:GxxExxY protein
VTRSDLLTYAIIGAAIDVSKELGIGLLESVYQTCFSHRLSAIGLSVQQHPTLSVVFNGIFMQQAFRPDLIVEQSVIVEVKAVAALLPIHEAQILNYMRLAGISRGLLINFNAFPFKSGIKRFVI